MLEQQLTTQAAEIAAAGHASWGNTMLDAAAELTALRKDAERYRWLRDKAPAFVVRPFADKPGAEWDGAIDTEMLARGVLGAA